MSSYDYSIKYKPGTNIVVVEVMCCLPLQENLKVPTPGYIIHLMDHLDDTTVNSADIHWHTSKVYQAVRSGINLPEGPLHSAFHTKRYELSVENGCLFCGSRVIIPDTLRQQFVKELHQCQPGYGKNESPDSKLRVVARDVCGYWGKG